jgi:hypothetical protein
LREVHVGHRTRGFTISVLITILDCVVVSHYGPVIWQAWSADPWVRMALLLIAGTASFSLADATERATRGIHKANSLAEEIGDTPFISVLDRLQIRSMTTIRNLEALRQLVVELEKLAGRQAA